jgi:hypothetical protein
MVLGSTQTLVKMSTRKIPGGKDGRRMRLTTPPPSRTECHEIWEPKSSETLWAKSGLLRDFFTLFYSYNSVGSVLDQTDLIGIITKFFVCFLHLHARCMPRQQTILFLLHDLPIRITGTHNYPEIRQCTRR